MPQTINNWPAEMPQTIHIQDFQQKGEIVSRKLNFFAFRSLAKFRYNLFREKMRKICGKKANILKFNSSQEKTKTNLYTENLLQYNCIGDCTEAELEHKAVPVQINHSDFNF